LKSTTRHLGVGENGAGRGVPHQSSLSMTSALDAGIELCGPGDNDRPASRFLAERVAGGIFFSPTVPGKTRRRVPMKFDAILQIHSNYSDILLVHTGPKMRRIRCGGREGAAKEGREASVAHVGPPLRS